MLEISSETSAKINISEDSHVRKDDKFQEQLSVSCISILQRTLLPEWTKKPVIVSDAKSRLSLSK